MTLGHRLPPASAVTNKIPTDDMMLAWFQQNFFGRSNPEGAKHNDQQNGKIQRVRQRACPGPALFFSSSSFFLSPPSSSHPAQTPTPAPTDPARQLKCMHVCMHARVRQPECDVIATRRRESALTNPLRPLIVVRLRFPFLRRLGWQPFLTADACSLNDAEKICPSLKFAEEETCTHDRGEVRTACLI